VTLADGTSLTPGTAVSYCGYPGAVNIEEYSRGLPPSIKCDLAYAQSLESDDTVSVSPASMGDGDSGGSVTHAGTTYLVGAISSSENLFQVGPESTTSYFSPVTPLGLSMAEIQWDLATD